MRSMRPTEPFDCRCSTRTRLESCIGLSGWSLSGLSFKGVEPTDRGPRQTVRPVSGKAGVTKAQPPRALAPKASATGPMLPASVESKVEQTLYITCRAPRAESQSKGGGGPLGCLAGLDRADLQRRNDRFRIVDLQAGRRHADGLNGRETIAVERVRKVGGARVVVGD